MQYRLLKSRLRSTGIEERETSAFKQWQGELPEFTPNWIKMYFSLHICEPSTSYWNLIHTQMWRKQGNSAGWFCCLNKVRWRSISPEHWKLPINYSFHSLAQFNSGLKLWSSMGVFYKLSWEHGVVLYTRLCRTSCIALYKQWCRYW